MPTYEYKCSACGHAFERFQSITADPIKKCPECGKNKVKRLIGTGAGLIFKGSGFYITDYRDSGYKDKAKAESGASSTSSNGEAGTKSGGESAAGTPPKSETTATQSTETKAEAKPAAKPNPTKSSKSNKSKTE